ncbi:hypothetical protein HOY80DRAFT_380837 [Tuber brumale]|nr:hypothetical protein HOY80DRAFT_380837 [Tuber brumale]
MNPLPTYTVAAHIYSAYLQKGSASIATGEAQGTAAAVARSRHQAPSAILPSVPPSRVPSHEFDDVKLSPTLDGTTSPTGVPPAQRTFQPLRQSQVPAVATKSEKAKVPPLAIAGIAAGGVIALCIALVAAFMALKRRRRIGHARQCSIASTDRAQSQSPTPIIEAEERDRPSSLRALPGGSAPPKKGTKHITWKDQICPDETFMTHHSLWPRSGSQTSGDGEEHRKPFRVDAMHGLPNAHLAYRSFSSPILGGHVSASGVCNSTISPVPGCIFPAHAHSLHSDSQFPHSHFLSSPQQQHQGPTALCTSIYSFLPGGGRRSLSDSFTTPGLYAPNPVRRSSIRQSGCVHTYSRSLFQPPHIGGFSRQSEYYDGRKPSDRGNGSSNNRHSAFVVMPGYSASISSVSSTSSSILNYTVGNTPQKLFRGGKTASVEASVEASVTAGVDDSSSPPSLESPATGGLTSPHSRRGGEVLFARGLFQGMASPSGGVDVCSGSGGDDDAALGSIGLALSPSFPSSLFDDTALSGKSSAGDVFLDRPSLDSAVSGQDITSSRHFSCSMPAGSRLLSLESPPSLREGREDSPDDTYFPTPLSSPTSPPRDYPPTPNPASELEFGPLSTLPVKSSRRMLGSVGSTYSPTLSMVNYYSSIARNPADTRFSSVNLFSPFTFPSPPGPTALTFSPVGSPMSRFERTSVDMGGSIQGSLVIDYSPKTRPISIGLESIATVGEGSLDLQGGLGITDGRSRRRRRYSSRFFANGKGVLVIDGGEVEEDWLDGGVSLGEERGERGERAKSAD